MSYLHKKEKGNLTIIWDPLISWIACLHPFISIDSFSFFKRFCGIDILSLLFTDKKTEWCYFSKEIIYK